MHDALAVGVAYLHPLGDDDCSDELLDTDASLSCHAFELFVDVLVERLHELCLHALFDQVLSGGNLGYIPVVYT